MKLNTPKPNEIYYRFFILLGLLRYPKRLWNFIKYGIRKFDPQVNYMPTMMDVEPTQRCNYRCVMCTAFNSKRKDMDFETFKRIIDEQYGLIEVKTQGVGEPLLNKDIIKMIEYARKKLIWVRTTTNGSLLHLNDNYKKLVDTGVHDINISIDGATKDVYEAIRVGGKYEQIVENCRLINTYNNKGRKTIIRAWVVLQKKNKHQLLDFPAFFSGLGFKEMTISFAMHNYGKEGENTEATIFDHTQEDYDRLFALCRKIGIKVSFFFHPHFTEENHCQIPFKRIYVTTDGYILPCCYIANQEVVNYGAYDKFDEIWFDKYVGFRRALKQKKTVPEYCRECYGGKQ